MADTGKNASTEAELAVAILRCNETIFDEEFYRTVIACWKSKVGKLSDLMPHMMVIKDSLREYKLHKNTCGLYKIDFLENYETHIEDMHKQLIRDYGYAQRKLTELQADLVLLQHKNAQKRAHPDGDRMDEETTFYDASTSDRTEKDFKEPERKKARVDSVKAKQ